MMLTAINAASQYRTGSGSDRMLESTNIDPKALKQSEQFSLSANIRSLPLAVLYEVLISRRTERRTLTIKTATSSQTECGAGRVPK